MQTADPVSGVCSEVTPAVTSPIQVTRSSMSPSVSGRLGMVTGDTRSQEMSQLTSLTLNIGIFSNCVAYLNKLPGDQSHRGVLRLMRGKWTGQDDSRSGTRA